MVAAIAGVTAVAGIAGSAMQADAAGDAAAGQQQATQQANALQYQMFRENQALQMPTIEAGNTARNRLMYRLGLSPTGTSGPPKKTYDQLRQQMLGQFTRTAPGASASGFNPSQLADPRLRSAYESALRAGANPADLAQQFGPLAQQDMSGGRWQTNYSGGVGDSTQQWVPGGGAPAGPTSTIDEAGLDAEIKRMLAEQDAEEARQRQLAESDPIYGGLAREYVAERYTPDKFAFTRDDFQADPGYEFRLQQGQKALDRKAAAGGRFFSGSALTGASNFAGDMASNEFGNAYNRALGTFGTNEGNRFNAFRANEGNRFGAFQANFNNAVNPLLSLAGAATLGSQNLGAASGSYAAQVGNNLTNNANAQGAAGIASAGQISSGINSAVGGYQQNQLMNRYLDQRDRTSAWGGVNNNPYPVGANYAGDSADWQG